VLICGVLVAAAVALSFGTVRVCVCRRCSRRWLDRLRRRCWATLLLLLFEDVADSLFLLGRPFSHLVLSCHCKDSFQCYLFLAKVEDLLLEHRVLTVLDEEEKELVPAC
jgi:hypothetical protein